MKLISIYFEQLNLIKNKNYYEISECIYYFN